MGPRLQTTNQHYYSNVDLHSMSDNPRELQPAGFYGYGQPRLNGSVSVPQMQTGMSIPQLRLPPGKLPTPQQAQPRAAEEEQKAKEREREERHERRRRRREKRRARKQQELEALKAEEQML